MMFTGLIEGIGIILDIRRSDTMFTLRCQCPWSDCLLGDSVAVRGVCLTLTKLDGYVVEAEVSPETLKMSNLGMLRKGERVNLERALQVGARFGGHIVAGHVDGIARVRANESAGAFRKITFSLTDDLRKFIVPKGSVAIDGASLTVNAVREDAFDIMLIPHSFEHLDGNLTKVGNTVNIETDIIGKYIANFMTSQQREAKNSLRVSDLIGQGF